MADITFNICQFGIAQATIEVKHIPTAHAKNESADAIDRLLAESNSKTESQIKETLIKKLQH